MSSKRGESPLAKPNTPKWTGKKRPFGWRGSVYGLVGHTTGAGLPAKALDNDQDVLERAEAHYLKSHGTHYVIGYKGDIIQVANEDMQANGVGMTDQINAVKNSSAKGWADKSFHGNIVAQARWAGRWASPEVGTPLDLFPTKFANSCYVHAEMPPCVFYYDDMLHIEATPHRPGLRFTTEQHHAIYLLALDIADRNGWTGDWWKTGRLVGHEDLSPITRGTSAGCWDPGWLRDEPWFDWVYVKERLEAEYKRRARAAEILEEATEEVLCAPSVKSPEETVSEAFVEWVTNLLKIFTRKK